MTQTYLISELLNSNSGTGLITEVIDRNPDYNDDQALNTLKGNPKLKAVINNLPKDVFNDLTDELNNIELKARLAGFKTGVDLALTLIGEKPIYNVLPEKLDKNGWI